MVHKTILGIICHAIDLPRKMPSLPLANNCLNAIILYIQGRTLRGCGGETPNNFRVSPKFLLLRKKSHHEKLCVVLDSRSKNIFPATVGRERVYTPKQNFNVSPYLYSIKNGCVLGVVYVLLSFETPLQVQEPVAVTSSCVG